MGRKEYLRLGFEHTEGSCYLSSNRHTVNAHGKMYGLNAALLYIVTMYCVEV